MFYFNLFTILVVATVIVAAISGGGGIHITDGPLITVFPFDKGGVMAVIALIFAVLVLRLLGRRFYICVNLDGTVLRDDSNYWFAKNNGHFGNYTDRGMNRYCREMEKANTPVCYWTALLFMTLRVFGVVVVGLTRRTKKRLKKPTLKNLGLLKYAFTHIRFSASAPAMLFTPTATFNKKPLKRIENCLRKLKFERKG